MSPVLPDLIDDLAATVPDEIGILGATIGEQLGGAAVLFYGSVLRTRDLDGVVDFYVLTRDRRGRGPRAWLTHWLWPDVSYHEIPVNGRVLRAKVATMPIDRFRAAAEGRLLDTTIWARFVQPSALVWSIDPAAAEAAYAAVAAAVVTAARFAAALGPTHGAPNAFWKALFAQTYATELRVEAKGREDQILAFDRVRYDRLLPLAWDAARIAFERDNDSLAPHLPHDDRHRLVQAWRARRRAGKALNAARLLKAAFTFDGAARYGLWKIERHTGLKIALTPWRERHPILAAPGVLWQVWRTASPK